MDGPRTEAYYYSSITGSRWYRAQLRGAQFGTPNRAPAPRGPDKGEQYPAPAPWWWCHQRASALHVLDTDVVEDGRDNPEAIIGVHVSNFMRLY